MFSMVSNPVVQVYDGETNKYLWQAKFYLTREMEQAILDMVNYGKTPSSFILQNFEISEPSQDAVPPTPFVKYKRFGVLTADLTESLSGQIIPVEVRFSWDVLFRSLPYGNQQFTSAEYSNIDIQEINYLF